jgi:hypothetical protein
MKRVGLELVLAALAAQACTTTWAEFGLVSTRDTGIRPTFIERAVKGQDCIYEVLFIPVSGRVEPSLGRAFTDALESAGAGNLLTNIKIERVSLLTILLNRSCIRLTGDVGSLK